MKKQRSQPHAGSAEVDVETITAFDAPAAPTLIVAASAQPVASAIAPTTPTAAFPAPVVLHAPAVADSPVTPMPADFRLIVETNVASVSTRAADAPAPEVIAKKLHEALKALPDKQRQVFEMRYFGDMTYTEIADLTQTSVGALKAGYFHAVKKIEKILTR